MVNVQEVAGRAAACRNKESTWGRIGHYGRRTVEQAQRVNSGANVAAVDMDLIFSATKGSLAVIRLANADVGWSCRRTRIHCWDMPLSRGPHRDSPHDIMCDPTSLWPTLREMCARIPPSVVAACAVGLGRAGGTWERRRGWDRGSRHGKWWHDRYLKTMRSVCTHVCGMIVSEIAGGRRRMRGVARGGLRAAMTGAGRRSRGERRLRGGEQPWMHGGCCCALGCDGGGEEGGTANAG